MDASIAARLHAPYKVIGLVGGAHSISHFFQLAVPAVFPSSAICLSVNGRTSWR